MAADILCRRHFLRLCFQRHLLRFILMAKKFSLIRFMAEAAAEVRTIPLCWTTGIDRNQLFRDCTMRLVAVVTSIHSEMFLPIASSVLQIRVLPAQTPIRRTLHSGLRSIEGLRFLEPSISRKATVNWTDAVTLESLGNPVSIIEVRLAAHFNRESITGFRVHRFFSHHMVKRSPHISSLVKVGSDMASPSLGSIHPACTGSLRGILDIIINLGDISRRRMFRIHPIINRDRIRYMSLLRACSSLTTL